MIVRKKEMLGEADFPIVIRPMRESIPDTVENARKALHEAVEIKCFYGGTSTLVVGNQSVTVHSGDVVVINPYELHATVNAGGENPGRYHLFMVSLDFFGGFEPDLRGFFFSQRKSFKTLISQNPYINNLLESVASESESKEEQYRTVIRGAMMQVFACLMRNYSVETTQVPPEEELHVYAVLEPALRRIRDGYAEEITVDELSRLCYISKEYFCRIFRKFTGKSAMEYLREYRLQIADTLLRTTSQGSAQIASACGFKDPNYFCRCFRQAYGCTPGDRRR